MTGDITALYRSMRAIFSMMMLYLEFLLCLSEEQGCLQTPDRRLLVVQQIWTWFRWCKYSCLQIGAKPTVVSDDAKEPPLGTWTAVLLPPSTFFDPPFVREGEGKTSWTPCDACLRSLMGTAIFQTPMGKCDWVEQGPQLLHCGRFVYEGQSGLQQQTLSQSRLVGLLYWYITVVLTFIWFYSTYCIHWF